MFAPSGKKMCRGLFAEFMSRNIKENKTMPFDSQPPPPVHQKYFFSPEVRFVCAEYYHKFRGLITEFWGNKY